MLVLTPMNTLASLKASQTARPDQIELYGVVDATRLALEYLVRDIIGREKNSPGSPPSPRHIFRARVAARNLSRALEDFA